MPRSQALSRAKSTISRLAAPPGTPSTAAAPIEARPAALAAATLLAVAAGLGLGVWSISYAVRSDTVGAVRAGPWQILADAGTVDINPYLRAHYARSGEVPLVLAQGVTALASQDGSGMPLDRACTYRVTGPMPPSLFWTLAAVGEHGVPFGNAAGRAAFSTDDIVRDETGAFAIVIADTVQPGNWLPVSGAGPFTLVLRLYDTRLSEPAGSGARGYPMPHIDRVSCA